MKLYSHSLSQHARRVRMLGAEIGLDIEEVQISLDKGEHRTNKFLEINPAGQIPVLIDGELVLPESHVIMKHLALNHGGEIFYPANHRRDIDRWLDWTHATLNVPVQAIAIEMFTKGDNAEKATISSMHERVARALDGYELGFGFDRVTLADLAIGSTLALYRMIGGTLDHHPKAARNFMALSERPSFSTTAPQM